MASNSVKAVFGGFPIGAGKWYPDEESIEKVYKLLEEGGCDTINTARLYDNSEEWLGKTGAGKWFTVDSKTPGGFPGPGTSTVTIPQHPKETVEHLGVKSVDDDPAKIWTKLQTVHKSRGSAPRITLPMRRRFHAIEKQEE
ncbi:hypothetical protein DFH08DRAFT_1031685 [Mycena albidolilacea]|uniref:NADP-dependent oxidoreductase domain-containing protein n=1 Tax=Mycena albidolilacea TaxID=1033008 RepID=A0AAD7F127_9AGAR|nr:hypothetical protein DFH08DRAFT_1031685 [Mycena albidolilacea]